MTNPEQALRSIGDAQGHGYGLPLAQPLDQAVANTQERTRQLTDPEQMGQPKLTDLEKVLQRHWRGPEPQASDNLFPLYPTATPPDTGDFGSGLKAGLLGTAPGMAFEYYRAKSMADAAVAEYKPDDNYDVFTDKRITPAYADQFGFLSGSRSAGETTSLLKQIELRKQFAQETAGSSDSHQMGALVGSFIPSMAIGMPAAAGGKFAAVPFWGRMATGVKYAAFNAELTLAGEAVAAATDPTYKGTAEGVVESLIIPSMLGFGVGVIVGGAKKLDAKLPPPGNKRPGLGFDPKAPLRETDDFKAFMEGNAVINPDGTPAPAYHGTSKAFHEFSGDFSGERTGEDLTGGGHWFSLDPATASAYATEEGGNVRPTYLRSTNPKNITAEIAPNATNDVEGMEKSLASVKAAIAKAKEEGHDSVVMHTTDGGDGHSVQLVVFDPKTQIRGLHERYDIPSVLDSAPHLGGGDWEEGEGVGFARSMGSSASPGMAEGRLAQLLDAEAPKSAMGIERLMAGVNPGFRLLASSSLVARNLVTKLVDLGGLKQNKNMASWAEATHSPVEADIARIWRVKSVRTINEVQAAWMEARTGIAHDADTITAPALKQQFLDWAKRNATISYGDFDERVAKAVRYGEDQVKDAHTPHVEKAAAATKKYFDDLKAAANDPEVDLFGKVRRRQLELLNKQIYKLKKDGGDLDQISALESRIDKLMEQAKHGPFQNTAPGYFPRMYDHELLHSEEGKASFIKEVADHYTNKMDLDEREARKLATGVHAEITQTNFRTVVEDAGDRFTADPGSAKARTFEIPDQVIEKYLLSSATMGIKHQANTFGPAIELTRRFGEASMEPQIKAMSAEYERLINEAQTSEKKVALQAEYKQAVQDVGALRDRLLNIAGASKDPHAWDQRTIRMLKHYMVWTTMGLSAMSQMGDFLRPALTEGLDAMYRHGFGTLIDKSRATIMAMSDKERMLSGDAMELAQASHSLAMANIGDTFNSRSSWERKANKATSAYFFLNGLNHVTEYTKRWGSLIIQGNVNDAIAQWGAHINGKGAAPPEAMLEKLRSLSIDGSMANRIASELGTHGIQHRSLRIANTEAWTDEGAQAAYRGALQRAIQRTVITPGALDRPTWMTTPVGSLVSQFRVFGMSSAIRTLYAGLQDGDRQFWTGAAALVGGAVVLNEIRHQMFSGNSSFSQPYLGVIADGIDRSGLLGSFMDANNAVEAATNNKLGLRPALGAGRHFPVTPDRMINSFFGPSAGAATLAASQLGSVASGDFSAQTWRKMRGFVPGQNLPYLDPVMDQMFPKGVGGRRPGQGPQNRQ